MDEARNISLWGYFWKKKRSNRSSCKPKQWSCIHILHYSFYLISSPFHHLPTLSFYTVAHSDWLSFLVHLISTLYTWLYEMSNLVVFIIIIPIYLISHWSCFWIIFQYLILNSHARSTCHHRLNFCQHFCQKQHHIYLSNDLSSLIVMSLLLWYSWAIFCVNSRSSILWYELSIYPSFLVFLILLCYLHTITCTGDSSHVTLTLGLSQVPQQEHS